jgi:hypothetical protein
MIVLHGVLYDTEIFPHCTETQDVNRVLVKPVVAPPEDDGHLSRVQLASEAWSR